MIQSLYDRDLVLWVEDTVSKLKVKDFDHLDLENLIEEVETLGRSEKRELLSRLTTLIEHLLKRIYVTIPDDYNGWERTIREQRKQLRLLLKDSPSLKSIWLESITEASVLAIADLRAEYAKIDFPDRWELETEPEPILNQIFW